MINVSKSAETIQDGIKNMMAGAKEDYAQTMGRNDSAYTRQKLENYESEITVREGKKYTKVIFDRSVFAFIVKEDFKHFKNPLGGRHLLLINQEVMFLLEITQYNGLVHYT